MTLVVLAAGMGSRYGGLKQIDPITENGEFIIDFSVYDAIRSGYDKVVFIIKKENYDLFRSTIGKRIENVIDVEYAFQGMDLLFDAGIPKDRVKPFGTAHALLSCRDCVKGSFSVINADDFYGRSAYQLASEYLGNVDQSQNGKHHYCMVGYRLGNTLTEHGTVSRGICEADPESMLVSITERTKIMRTGDAMGAAYESEGKWIPISADSIASMNFFGFTDSFFPYVEEGFERFLRAESTDKMKGEYYLPSAVSEVLAAGKADLKVLSSSDLWYGVTYKEDKQYVIDSIQKMIAAGIYPQNLWG